MINKKILYLCDYSLDAIGGAQKSLLTMANAMDQLGYKVIITSDLIKDKEFSVSENITIQQWKKPANKYMAIISKMFLLIKCIRKYKPDVVHAQFSQFAFAMLLARKYKLISGKVPLVFTDRHHFLGYNDRYKNMFVNNLGYLKKIIFTTENNRKEWEKALGHEIEHSAVVSNVLEDKWFEQKCESPNHDGKIYVGFAGRFVDWKRWDTVLEISEKLCKDGRYVISIAISAPKGEEKSVDDYIKQLEEKTRGQLNVVRDGDEDEMLKFYGELDFFVLTSENESFGRTLIEAMTQNTVVLSTNSGGAPEVVGRNDTIFEVADSEEASNIIKTIAFDESKLDSYKKWFNNRSKSFSRDSMKQKMNDIYMQILDN